MKKIIFICHGSICRSPAAEFIAKNYLKNINRDKEFKITSRAISLEEIGNDIYPPMKQVLDYLEIPYNKHSASFLRKKDIEECDYLFYMDASNYRLLTSFFGENSKFKPIFEYSKEFKEIEDPWYTGRYEKVVYQISKCIEDIFKNI